ncbi:hypothetical protein HMI54_011055 [Coelomomyces lativittatus]|nr:hypothetical protein HMI54_011055 [Coelomomyces lativittatus]
MDRNNTDQAKMSIGFIDYMCYPLFTSLLKLLPEMKEFIDNMNNNRRMWSEFKPNTSTIIQNTRSPIPEHTRTPPILLVNQRPLSAGLKKAIVEQPIQTNVPQSIVNERKSPLHRKARINVLDLNSKLSIFNLDSLGSASILPNSSNNTNIINININNINTNSKPTTPTNNFIMQHTTGIERRRSSIDLTASLEKRRSSIDLSSLVQLSPQKSHSNPSLFKPSL